jgi:hypothetical protein
MRFALTRRKTPKKKSNGAIPHISTEPRVYPYKEFLKCVELGCFPATYCVFTENGSLQNSSHRY